MTKPHGCGSRYCAISPNARGCYSACSCSHLDLITEISRLRTDNGRLLSIIKRHNKELAAELEKETA